jgi:hypothetical protein
MHWIVSYLTACTYKKQGLYRMSDYLQTSCYNQLTTYTLVKNENKYMSFAPLLNF